MMASSQIRTIACATIDKSVKQACLRSKTPTWSRHRAFATSRRRSAESQQTEDQQRQQQQHEERRRQRQEESRRREEEQGPAPGVTPWARFMEVLKAEYQKSQELNHARKELAGKAGEIQDSEAFQRARKMYTAMHLENLIKENPRLASMASNISKTGRSVSDLVDRTAKDIEDSRFLVAARKAAAQVDKAIEPIRQTEAYKAVEGTVDFSQGALRYGGYVEREERLRKRQKRLQRLGKADRGMGVLGGPGSKADREVAEREAETSTGEYDINPPPASEDVPEVQPVDPSEPHIAANPDAAPALVLHATANNNAGDGKSAFERLAPKPLRDALASFSAAYQESDNSVVATMRSVTGAVGRFFDETETAKVVKWVKEMDPEFEMDGFLRDLREYVVPEIVDAYISADLKALKLWTSEGAYNVIAAPIQLYLQRGLKPASQVIDLRGIDIMSAKILEERDLPVFVVAFRSHEISAFINPATGAVEAGNADQIDQVQYVIVMTREAATCGDERTGGWRIIDMARRGQAAFL